MVKWQGCETVISGIRWMFMLDKLFVARCGIACKWLPWLLGHLQASQEAQMQSAFHVRSLQDADFLGGALV